MAQELNIERTPVVKRAFDAIRKLQELSKANAPQFNDIPTDVKPVDRFDLYAGDIVLARRTSCSINQPITHLCVVCLQDGRKLNPVFINDDGHYEAIALFDWYIYATGINCDDVDKAYAEWQAELASKPNNEADKDIPVTLNLYEFKALMQHLIWLEKHVVGTSLAKNAFKIEVEEDYGSLQDLLTAKLEQVNAIGVQSNK